MVTNMELKQQSEHYHPRIIVRKDICQCDGCKEWLKLREPLEDDMPKGGRLIPLYQHQASKFNWLCTDCWKELDEEMFRKTWT